MIPRRIENTVSLSNLAGHLFGDGHISPNYWVSYTNKSEMLQKEFEVGVRNVFGFKIKPRVPYHKAFIYEYPYVVGVILHLVGVPIGNKKHSRCTVPDWVMNGSQDIKVAFIRAIFDDESSVKVRNKEIILKMAKACDMVDVLTIF